MLSAGATWKAKENPAPVRAAYLRSKASRPEVLSRSPCSAPIKLSSPEDSTYKRRYLRRTGARRSAGIEPPVFPLVIHAPQLPRKKKNSSTRLESDLLFRLFHEVSVWLSGDRSRKWRRPPGSHAGAA